jgi:hypothetical protein
MLLFLNGNFIIVTIKQFACNQKTNTKSTEENNAKSYLSKFSAVLVIFRWLSCTGVFLNI